MVAEHSFYRRCFTIQRMRFGKHAKVFCLVLQDETLLSSLAVRPGAHFLRKADCSVDSVNQPPANSVKSKAFT